MVNIRCGAAIKPVPITWLWNGWLPAGKLTILAGAAGTGKTTLALGLAATLTSGSRWPDGSHCRAKGNVLIWSSEDVADDTLVPGTKPVPAPECVYVHRSEYDPCALPRATAGLEDANVESRAASATPGIRTFSLLPYLCDVTTCHSVIGGVVVYFDDHHLSASFSRSIGPYLGAAIGESLEG